MSCVQDDLHEAIEQLLAVIEVLELASVPIRAQPDEWDREFLAEIVTLLARCDGAAQVARRINGDAS